MNKNILRSAIGGIAEEAVSHLIPMMFTAEVVDVDVNGRTCSVTSLSQETEVDYDKVLLMTEVADGVLYVPAKGSTVLVACPRNLPAYVLMWSELEDVYLVADNVIQFNDGKNGGIPKVAILTDRIVRLEKALNNLAGVFNAHTHTVSSIVSGVPNPVVPPLTTPAALSPLTQRSDLEDTKVTH